MKVTQVVLMGRGRCEAAAFSPLPPPTNFKVSVSARAAWPRPHFFGLGVALSHYEQQDGTLTATVRELREQKAG